MIHKVLMPVDFSPRDAAAAHYVRQLHKRMAFETTLLHVVPPPDYDAALLETGGAALEMLIEARQKMGEEKLAKACEGELTGMNCQRVLRSGFPSEEIVEYSNEQGIDLIVMPTHGFGPFRRFLLGSVTSKILHDARCAVMTGAHMADPMFEEIPFQTVGVAIDLSDNSARVLDYGAKLAQALGAKLLVMHALSGLKGHIGITLEQSFELHFESAVRERIQELTKDLPQGTEVVVETGEAAATIRDMVTVAKADVLVIGRSTSEGLGRIRAQSYAIIRESPAPVVSV
jgi:nucleotide-binding universal stress UspA family protein